MEDSNEYEDNQNDTRATQPESWTEKAELEEGEPVDKHDDACKKQEKKGKCICKSEKKSGKHKMPKSHNPFIIFYLMMYFKSPGKPVTEVARRAGKEWCALPDSKKEIYIRLAKKVSIERCRKRMKKKRGKH